MSHPRRPIRTVRTHIEDAVRGVTDRPRTVNRGHAGRNLLLGATLGITGAAAVAGLMHNHNSKAPEDVQVQHHDMHTKRNSPPPFPNQVGEKQYLQVAFTADAIRGLGKCMLGEDINLGMHTSGKDTVTNQGSPLLAGKDGKVGTADDLPTVTISRNTNTAEISVELRQSGRYVRETSLGDAKDPAFKGPADVTTLMDASYDSTSTPERIEIGGDGHTTTLEQGRDEHGETTMTNWRIKYDHGAWKTAEDADIYNMEGHVLDVVAHSAIDAGVTTCMPDDYLSPPPGYVMPSADASPTPSASGSAHAVNPSASPSHTSTVLPLSSYTLGGQRS